MTINQTLFDILSEIINARLDSHFIIVCTFDNMKTNPIEENI